MFIMVANFLPFVDLLQFWKQSKKSFGTKSITFLKIKMDFYKLSQKAIPRIPKCFVLLWRH